MTRIGIDAGQSGLRLQVVGQEDVRSTAGVAHGDDLLVSYANRLMDVWPRTEDDVERVVAGVAARPASEPGRVDLATMIGNILGCADVWLSDDTVTAHAAAFGGNQGLVLTVGSGVACLVLDPRGQVRTVDGAGPLIGDEGSGFNIGRAGLAAAIRASSTAGSETDLLDRACEHFDCTPSTLAEAIHQTTRPTVAIAAFAREVLELAHSDDVSNRIVVDAAAALVGTTRTALNGQRLDVAVSGGLLGPGTLLRTEYESQLGVRVVSAPPPLSGACWLATQSEPGPYSVDRVFVKHFEADGVTARRYLTTATALIRAVPDTELDVITRVATVLVDCLSNGGLIHTFGTGHSHLLAQEIFYRAGGLARVNPILESDLMLHISAADSTSAERSPGRAAQILELHPIQSGDVLIVASNSGGNRVSVELADLAAAQGATVIAITSRRHATSALARQAEGVHLHDVAHIVLDNFGEVGDAALFVPGLDTHIGATSTVVGSAILQAVVAECIALAVRRRVIPEIFQSANTAEGDLANRDLIEKYRSVITCL